MSNTASPTPGGTPPTSKVRSRDGTEIAVWPSGSGPPLVLVHGAAADHTRWRPLLPYLEPQFTIFTLDRRGRGESTDEPNDALDREFEDLAAVVDDIATSSRSPVHVYGPSFGGNVAFGAAGMTSNIDRLLLYEGSPVPDPSVWALPADLEARMDALLAEGARDAVVELLFRELEDLSDDDMSAFKAAPSWPGRVAAAPTITREIRSLMTSRLDADIARTITIPVLLVIGEHSADLTQPPVQVPIARRGRRERLDTQQRAGGIERGGNVLVEVRVHATRHRARALYDGHCHPFSLQLVEGWHARPVTETVSSRLLLQPTRSPSGTGRAPLEAGERNHHSRTPLANPPSHWAGWDTLDGRSGRSVSVMRDSSDVERWNRVVSTEWCRVAARQRASGGEACGRARLPALRSTRDWSAPVRTRRWPSRRVPRRGDRHWDWCRSGVDDDRSESGRALHQLRA